MIQDSQTRETGTRSDRKYRANGHRDEWIKRHPKSLIENGGILSRSDLARWACDKCMAPLNPERPIRVIGGSEGHSMCDTCAPSPAQVEYTDCTCLGCKSAGDFYAENHI